MHLALVRTATLFFHAVGMDAFCRVEYGDWEHAENEKRDESEHLVPGRHVGRLGQLTQQVFRLIAFLTVCVLPSTE